MYGFVKELISPNTGLKIIPIYKFFNE